MTSTSNPEKVNSTLLHVQTIYVRT